MPMRRQEGSFCEPFLMELQSQFLSISAPDRYRASSESRFRDRSPRCAGSVYCRCFACCIMRGGQRSLLLTRNGIAQQCSLGAAGLNLLLNFLLIPRCWQGAVASLLTDGSLAFSSRLGGGKYSVNYFMA